MSAEYSETCRICGGEDLTVVANTIRGGIQSDVFACQECEMIFLPRKFFNIDNLEEHYNTNYVYTPSLGKLLGSEYDPYTMYVKHIEYLLDSENTELFEIGAGPGHFISQIKDRVKKVEAVELHPGQADHCRNEYGIKVYADPIEKLDLKESFDIVCLFSVLEHVPDPKIFLAQAMSFVKPGGTLFIEVPNSQDPLLALYDVTEYSAMYFRSEHIFNYNRSSLSKLFEVLNFTNFDIEARQGYSLTNHIHWASTGKGQTSTELGYRFNFPKPIKEGPIKPSQLQNLFDKMDREYRSFLVENGYGDMLFAKVRKPF